MDLDEIKRGLRAEIKKRENEQYLTFQCNVRQMCKDVLAKLEEQESVIAEKDAEIARLKAIRKVHTEAIESMGAGLQQDEEKILHHKYKRCLNKAEMCEARYDEEDAKVNGCGLSWEYISKEMKYWERWHGVGWNLPRNSNLTRRRSDVRVLYV